MRPDDARTIANFLLQNLEHEIAITLSVFEAVPSDRLDYRPDPVSKTALGLVRHLTLEDEWLLECVANGRFHPPPDDSDACGIMTPADAVACYRTRLEAAIGRVRALPDAALAQDMDFFGTPVPAVGILAMTIRHSAHHRGQLSSYLRAMGGKVPAIYGPSADTATVGS